jgi:hypothetical protein
VRPPSVMLVTGGHAPIESEAHSVVDLHRELLILLLRSTVRVDDCASPCEDRMCTLDLLVSVAVVPKHQYAFSKHPCSSLEGSSPPPPACVSLDALALRLKCAFPVDSLAIVPIFRISRDTKRIRLFLALFPIVTMDATAPKNAGPIKLAKVSILLSVGAGGCD